MSRTIATLDLIFLLSETREAPQHVGGLMLFENPHAKAGWTIADLVAHYRAAKPIAPFNAIPQLAVLGRPRWQTLSDPDMHYHVRHLALPAPGSDAQLTDMVQQWHCELMDRHHPLFQIFVIEGLSGGRFAILAKVHHSIIDGASGIMRLIASLSKDPKAKLDAPFYAVDMGVKSRKWPRSLIAQLSGTSGSLLKQASALTQVASGLWKKTAGRIAGESVSMPFDAAMTLLNQRIRQGRTFAHISLPLAPFRLAAKAAGGTINDATLAVVDAAVEAYLRERGETPKQALVALVPVSMREPGDKEASTKISAVVSPLGEPGAPMAQRLKQVVRRMNAAKDEIRAMSKAAATDYGVGIYALAEGLSSIGVERALANFVVSNVPGPTDPLYLGGSRFLGVHAASVLVGGVGLNVTVASNAGNLDFGITGYKHVLPDPDRLAFFCAQALEQLQSSLSTPSSIKRVSTSLKARASKKATK